MMQFRDYKFNGVNAGRPGRRTAQRAVPTRGRSGMALVITLIMLSVTLVMAIAFLAVSRRERNAVRIASDAANAKHGAEIALAAGEAQILANVMSGSNGGYIFPLLVSTNYVNPYGYNPYLVNPALAANPTNVNFDYEWNGAAFSAADRNQDIANLLYLPRAPVMVSSVETNGRYYLDLNRNGQFEPTGPFIPDVNTNGTTNVFDPVTGQLSFLSEVGDPQWVGVLERPDTVHAPDNKFIIRYAFIAVPVGNGLDINYIYNEAVGRQVNPLNGPPSSVNDTFMRNQEVGSWEINLAAFLADLNTNQWLKVAATNQNNIYYNYNEPYGFNVGLAFDDARALISYRYNYNYNNLLSASFLFRLPQVTFPRDNIDEYSDGPYQFFTTNIFENAGALDGDNINNNFSWAGSPSPNQFFTPSDFFDRTKTQTGYPAGVPGFTDRLVNAGTNTYGNPYSAVATYDRYTLYRMLTQLGTDSEEDDTGKLDLNYDNTDGRGNVVPHAQTNLLHWTALAFFTNAADRMVRTYTTDWFKAGPSNYLATYFGLNYQFPMDPATGYGYTNYYLSSGQPLYNGLPIGTNFIPSFSLTNLPVYINGQWVFSPAVHRLLQLAANIYDASTNNIYPNNGFFPSVFRPNFFKDVNGNVYIDGFNQIPPTLSVVPGTTPLDQPITITANLLSTGFNSADPSIPNRNVYGVPWIIGAKKNLPNFNQFYMENTAQVTRKAQVNRRVVEAYSRGRTSQDFSTNQIYIMSITNQIGVSFWNSYQTNYPGGLPIVYSMDVCWMTLTNSVGGNNGPVFISPVTNIFYYTNLAQASPAIAWPGANWDFNLAPGFGTAADNSFYYSAGDFDLLSPEQYSTTTHSFSPLPGNGQPAFDTNDVSVANLDQFGLTTSNWFQAYIVDNGHVIDYVQFDGPSGSRNLNNELFDNVNGTVPTSDMWATNLNAVGLNYGLANQLYVSQQGTGFPANSWRLSGLVPGGTPDSVANEAGYFRAFFAGAPITVNGTRLESTNLSQQAPYSPTRTMAQVTVWQANDPLVHYMPGDLIDLDGFTGAVKSDTIISPAPSVNQHSVGVSSQSAIQDDRYQPWGVANQMRSLQNVDTNAFNLSYRDPLVYSSDNWDFPENHYPAVGWLGRVHRGTPWQTVFLKSTNILQYSYQVNPQAPLLSGLTTWQYWSGDFNEVDAKDNSPLEDRLLFDVFTTAVNDNASKGTLSVNQHDTAAWSAVLGGMNVISNTTAFPNYGQAPAQTNLQILPAGPDTNSAVFQIVHGALGINATRDDKLAFPVGAFTHVGDILRVPMLSDSSPFVNHSTQAQMQYDISDEMYEQIPQQLMGLVRLGNPRYVIYCYGQALRPADGGTVLSGNFFGMVTNYQVAAESAVRAVVELQPSVQVTFPNGTLNPPVMVTNYTTKVINYSPLAPDQ